MSETYCQRISPPDKNAIAASASPGALIKMGLKGLEQFNLTEGLTSQSPQKVYSRTMKTATVVKLLALPLFVSVTLSVSPSLASPPEQAVGYWTKAAMDSAKPVRMLVDPKTGLGTLSVEPTATNTSGADWVDGGVPQMAVGKVFFSIGRANYVCSGSVVGDGFTANNIAIVVTAAHCVIDRGRFVTNWAFVPDHDSGKRVAWYAKNLVVRTEFAAQRQFNTTAILHDWAFAVIPSGTFTKNKKRFTNPTSQLDADNAFNYSQTGFATVGQLSTAFGYPAGGIYSPGDLLKYAQSNIVNDPAGVATWGMPSDLTGGASGGPWLSDLTAGNVSSVNSYKYTNDPTRMYGPKFGDKTGATFNAAKAATGSLDIINK